MPTVDAAKIKLRRGLNLDRKKVVLDEGELGYTTDTKRVYVGDGALLGGKPVGAHNFQVQGIPDIIYAEPGDFTYQNNVFYSLTGTDFNSIDNWVNLNPKVDGTTLEYDSKNVLSVKASGMTLSTVGAGLALDGSNDPYVNLASDAQTTALLSFNGSNEIVVRNLTDISHGSLGFKDSSTGNQHHSNADDTNPGFMSNTFFTKVKNSPTFPIATDDDANKLVNGINRSTADKIDSTRISGDLAATTSVTSNQVIRATGQDDTKSTFLSGDSLTTPYYFLNREDFPGVIVDSSIPTGYADNQGSYNNIKLTNVGGNTTDDTYYQDKCFILPSGNGQLYAIFIQNPSDESAKNAFITSYPQYTVSACDYNSTQSTLITNIINAIKDIVNEYEERLFDVWEGAVTGEIYIHGLEKGYTPPFNSSLAQGPDSAYTISTTGSNDITYEKSTTGQSKQGTEFDAGDATDGKLNLSKLGWLTLNASAQQFTVKGVNAIHTITSFPGGSSDLNSKYFIIYDSNDDRYCVWYNIDSGGLAPDISETHSRRGRKSYMIEVSVSDGNTVDEVANLTKDALENHVTFNSMYTVSYSDSTMTLTSKEAGYNDGIVNRIHVGMPTALFTPNATVGKPNVVKLNAAFYTAYAESPPNNEQLDTTITIPGKTATELIKGGDTTIETTPLIKFR